MLNQTSESRFPGVDLPPVAPMLMQSLRAVGYTASAALADIVDNSIAAGATTVRISLSMEPDAFVSVLDDGAGMDEQTLVSAMRFGSRDPRDARSTRDLGRFGLGMKTASLSQCRRLTVASFHNGSLAAARWDLDECDRRSAWWLQRPPIETLPTALMSALSQQGRGTVVIWEKLDRLGGAGGGDPTKAIEDAILGAADHLTLAFHRFLAGELIGPFSILMNQRPLPIFDPFLEGHVRGQTLHPETFMIEGHPVRVSPFVLPYPSRLKPAELERAGGRESLKTGHGFYIYRGGRLVVPGGWFRIMPADELVRLARIRVDVPVELDHLWKVDIRKTVAEPPLALRPLLKRVVGEVTARSRKVYTYKGTPAHDSQRLPVWQRQNLREGAAAWRINRDHPAIRSCIAATAGIAGVPALLKLIEDMIPVHDIHIHLANDQALAEPEMPDEAELFEQAKRWVETFADQPDTAARILEQLPFTEPFNRNPDAARRIAQRFRP